MVSYCSVIKVVILNNLQLDICVFFKSQPNAIKIRKPKQENYGKSEQLFYILGQGISILNMSWLQSQQHKHGNQST